ncbi:MAG: hypothetical protein QOJ99_4367 [Bryobacterales bacterium]|nr:hypothetical protein [Bryobacterales bacterium]
MHEAIEPSLPRNLGLDLRFAQGFLLTARKAGLIVFRQLSTFDLLNCGYRGGGCGHRALVMHYCQCHGTRCLSDCSGGCD